MPRIARARRRGDYWSRADSKVRAVQDTADALRTRVVLEAVRAVFDDEEEALNHARWDIYLLGDVVERRADSPAQAG
ncbi:hypothetical protein [Nocardia sp. NPDC004711]